MEAYRGYWPTRYFWCYWPTGVRQDQWVLKGLMAHKESVGPAGPIGPNGANGAQGPIGLTGPTVLKGPMERKALGKMGHKDRLVLLAHRDQSDQQDLWVLMGQMALLVHRDLLVLRELLVQLGYLSMGTFTTQVMK